LENRNNSSEDKNLSENNGSSENKKDNYLLENENLWESENLSEDNNLSENENLLEDIEDINNSLESEDDDTIDILSDDEFSSDSDNFNLAEGNNI
jgi:hypothetical protein